MPSRGMSETMVGLRAAVEPVVNIDLSGAMAAVAAFSDAILKRSCMEKLEKTQESIRKLNNLLRGASSVEAIKKDALRHMKEIHSQAAFNLNWIRTETLNESHRSAIQAIYRPIRTAAKKSIDDSDQYLYPELFRVKQAKKVLFEKKLARLVAESQDSQEAIGGELNSFLRDMGKWLKANGARRPGTVFFSYAWPAGSSVEYSWLQDFLMRIKAYLEQVGIRSHLDIESPYAQSSISDYMREKLDEAEFVLLMGTPDLLVKHEGSVKTIQSELPMIATKREYCKDRGMRSPVIPINLAFDYKSAFPSEYDKYTNVREWSSQGYLLNLKGLIDYIYDRAGVPAYEKRWAQFFEKLEDEYGYSVRRSPATSPAQSQARRRVRRVEPTQSPVPQRVSRARAPLETERQQEARPAPAPQCRFAQLMQEAGENGSLWELVVAQPSLLNKKDYLLNKKDYMGLTAAHWAAGFGDLKALRGMLKRKPELRGARDNEGQTLAHWAARNGRMNMVMKLLDSQKKKRRVLLDVRDNASLTPAHTAARYGQTEILEAMLEMKPRLLDATDDAGRTVAHWAVGSGVEYSLFKMLMNNRPNLLDVVDRDGWNAAHWAAMYGKTEALRLLSARRPALLRVRDNAGLTPADWAARNEHTSTHEMLLATRRQVPAAIGLSGVSMLRGGRASRREGVSSRTPFLVKLGTPRTNFFQ